MAYLDQVASYIDANTALVLGTDLFKGYLPDLPDTCVAVYETAGPAPRETLTLTLVERPNLQVVSRSVDYPGARVNAQNVWNLLHQVVDETLSGVRYLRMVPLQSPFYLGRDESLRVKFAFNMTVEKELG